VHEDSRTFGAEGDAGLAPRPAFRASSALLIRLAALLWLVVHFALTAAFVAPLSPLTLSLQPLLNATIGTYFPQGWGFFAPNPGASVAVLLVRPLSDAELAAVAARGLPDDGWYDLSTPLWDAFHQNHFSAYDRLALPQFRAMLSYLTGSQQLDPFRDACERGDADACTQYDAAMAETRAKAARILVKVASAFCRETARSGPEIRYVALRARELRSVPWPDRYGGQPVTRDVDLGVYAVDDEAVPSGLFRAGPPR
jgi:hypothetical protein